MKKVNWIVVIAGALVGLAAVLLTALGNPANMGFCIACFLRDIAGACSLHGAAKVQYVRPEIIGLVLGSFIMAHRQVPRQTRRSTHHRIPMHPFALFLRFRHAAF